MAIDQKKYLRLFQNESEPHLEKIVKSTEKLQMGEENPEPHLTALAESLHYLKGALGLLGLKDLRESTIQAEKTVKQIIAENRKAAPEETGELIRVVELIRDTVQKSLET